MRSCARMSARGWPKLRRGRGGRGVAHRIGVPPVRLFGGRILPPAVFRRCCRALCRSRARYFWLRSESASAASTRRRRGARAQDAPSASCCWSWASIAARPPDRPESSANTPERAWCGPGKYKGQSAAQEALFRRFSGRFGRAEVPEKRGRGARNPASAILPGTEQSRRGGSGGGRRRCALRRVST